MAKKLIIAEKPSVAGDVGRALGGFARKGDYYESERYVLSSAVGHLLELAVPDEYEVKRGKWSFKHLPVIPPRFELAPLEKSEQRLNLLLFVLLSLNICLNIATLKAPQIANFKPDQLSSHSEGVCSRPCFLISSSLTR